MPTTLMRYAVVIFYGFETLNETNMNIKRIEEIQKETAYPDSISVQQALLKVWNECEQEKVVKNNAVLPLVIWRNWLLPFIICLFVAVFFRVLFHYLPKNIFTTDFFAGWISCMALYIARKYYAI